MNSNSIHQNMKSLVVAICIIFLPVDKSFGQLTWVQSDKIVPDGAMNGDEFGRKIAVDNSFLIVGSPGDEQGATYLYDLRTGQLVSNLVPEDSEFSLFGFEVAAKNGIAAVSSFGKPFENLVYLFDLSTGKQIHRFLDPSDSSSATFGFALAFNESSICVTDPNAHATGAVYVFDLDSQMQKTVLVPNDTENGISFGFSVDVDEHIAIIGAIGDDTNGQSAGAAYLFDIESGKQLHKLLPSDGNAFDSFGTSVGIVGDIAIVGAPCDDDIGTNSGSTYLFDVANGKQLAKLLPSDGGARSFFGGSISVDGSIAVIGASGSTENELTFAGSAYVFDVNTGKQLAKILPLDVAAFDRFGFAVALK